MQMYCLKCKGKKQIVNYQVVTVKNGRKMAKSSCPDCGTTVNKILSADEATA